MRTFNAISSWLLWVLTVLLWLMFLFIRVVNAIPLVAATPDHAASYTNLFWGSLALMTGLSTIAYFALRQFWHRAGRPPGFWFWLISVFLYLCVAFIPASGFSPYFAVGDRSILQWVSLALGALFLALSFPRLPSAPSQAPPSLPT
jgi:hypothetical protein